MSAMKLKSVWQGGKSPLTRFFEKFKKDPQTGCWLWIASVDHRGYGQLQTGGRLWKSHRWSYMMFIGDPGNLCVCHTCDTPACVNPQHLWLGTHFENMQDAVTKGRIDISGDRNPSRKHPERMAQLAGEKHPKAKLTWDAVRQIRHRYAAGGVSLRRLAAEHGVTNTAICDVVNCVTWIE